MSLILQTLFMTALVAMNGAWLIFHGVVARTLSVPGWIACLFILCMLSALAWESWKELIQAIRNGEL